MMPEMFLSLLGDEGKYAYFETSIYQEGSRIMIPDQVTMKTKVYTNSYCMSFWYHMYGSTMGTLEVKIGGSTIFTKTGDQGNHWINKKIDVSNYGNPYRVRLTLSGDTLSGKSDEFFEK